MDNQQTVGLIGLGNMGSAIATRLMACDQSLVVYDISPAAVSRLTKKGVTAATSPRNVAEQADIVLTVLPNGPDVEAVADGPHGVWASAQPGLLWLEMSTIDPEVTRRLAKRGAEQRVTVMDAAIGGLTGDAVEGKLLLMVGGNEADVARAASFLSLLGEIVPCGPTGAGVSMKLVNNQLAGVAFTATCEALLLGRKAGLSFETMQRVLSGTAANTAHLHRSVPERVLKRNFEPGFCFNLMVKDAGLALTLAHRLGSPQLLATVVQELRLTALSQDLGDKDVTSFIQVLEQLAGIRLDG